MISQLRTATVFLALMTFLLGAVYPAIVWMVGQLAFPYEANGSLIMSWEETKGSALLGQHFQADRYFWSRLSDTPAFPYNAQNSGSAHLNADHPELLNKAKDRLNKLNLSEEQPPIDLVTSSGSGLDPHISPHAARVQVKRIARERNLDEQILLDLISQHTSNPTFGFLGETTVNVLQLNLALDTI
ncbi:MAG: potassium-transporting ATPase subunit KdpC [Bdellovibrionales bacterium]